MRRLLVATLFVLTSLPAFAAQKTINATYTAVVANVPAGLPELKVWIPLPESRGWQQVSSVEIEAPFPFTRHREKEFGNEYAYTVIPNPPAGDLTVRVKFTATRQEAIAPVDRSASRAELQRALRADKLVTISPRIRDLANRLTRGISDPYEQAHAFFDYLVVTMKYDKTIAGWGRGDSERMCDIRAGNCTDFHSLFMSLARAKGIPARFVIGFPVNGLDGDVKGYHCWAEFYVKGRGWIPVDASDASKLKDPAAQQYLFGHLDPNRVQFTMGRDLVLTPRTSEPLNYFIYPHAEAAGNTVGEPKISLRFREITQSASAE